MKAVTIMTLAALTFPYSAAAHDIYTDWQRPDTGTSCCKGRKAENGSETGDCGPTKAYFDGKNWHALFHGKYIKVPPHLVLKTRNPDGNAHLCAIPGTVFCFMPPEAKF